MLDPALKGKTSAPSVYEMSREKIREYAQAIGETNPIYFDVASARAQGYPDLVCPPTGASIFALRPIMDLLLEPGSNINVARLVHGEQEYEFVAPVFAGDTLTTVATITDVYSRGNLDFILFETVSRNQHGQTAVIGRANMIIRG